MAATTGALLAWIGVTPRAVEARSGLIVDATAPVLQGAAPDPTVVRSRYVTLNADVLPKPDGRTLAREPALVLELFSDVTIRAVFDRFDTNPAGVTWVGHIDTAPLSLVTLVMRDGLLTGSVLAVDHVYSIRPAPADVRAVIPQPGGNLHVVTEVNQNGFRRESAPLEVALPAGARPVAVTPQDGPPVIDVMVVYTPMVNLTVGGTAAVASLIDLAASETNTSYINSNVSQRIRIVHTEPVNYPDNDSFATSLNDLRIGTGGLSGVGGLRETYHADLVMMLVRPVNPDACGIAYLQTAITTSFASLGFSVVDSSCISNLTFPHELGHNMGARHDWFVDSGVTPFTYAHGYINPAPGQRWRTIMSYPDLCTLQGFGCTRVPYWANPSLQYVPYCTSGAFDCSKLQFWYFPGSNMGIPGGTNSTCRAGSILSTNCDADDARVLNASGSTVAAFRTP